jgi:hypothetical protein
MATEKEQKDKQRSTKHTHKTKDRVTRTPLKTRMNSCVPEGRTVHASLVAPVYVVAKTQEILKNIHLHLYSCFLLKHRSPTTILYYDQYVCLSQLL